MKIHSPTITLTLLLVSTTTALGQDYLLEHRARLEGAAAEAERSESPSERARIQVGAVANESSDLAIRGLGVRNERGRANLDRVFRSSTYMATYGYDRGTQSGRSQAERTAYHHLPAAVAALDGRALPTEADARRAISIINRASAEDVSRIVSKILKVEVEGGRHDRIVDQVPHSFGPKREFVHRVDNMPREAGTERPLDAKELKVLEAGIRLMDSAYKAGRAQEASATGAVSPREGGRYNPLDLKLREVFERASTFHVDHSGGEIDRAGSPRTARRIKARVQKEAVVAGLAGAVKDVYHDLFKLKQAYKHETPGEREAYQKKVRRRLETAYLHELKGRTIPDLVKEAVAEGLDLKASKKRLTKAGIIASLTRSSPSLVREVLPGATKRKHARGAAEVLRDQARARRRARRYY